MIKETVCAYCSYRFRFDLDQPYTHCPICGNVEPTGSITLIRSVEEEDP